MAWFPLGNYRDTLRQQSQVYLNINFSTATRGKLHAPHIVPGWELIPSLWLKMLANFPQVPEVEFSLSSRDVRRPLCFLTQVECTPRGPDSKEGSISLQWLKFRIVFHLTRLRHVWIPCGDSRERRRCPPHQDRGPHIPITQRKAHGIPYFIRWRCLTLLKMDRNPNITVPKRKWTSVSCLTARSVCIVLPSLV